MAAQLTEAERAAFERLMRAQVVSFLLDTEWNADMGQAEMKPVAEHHVQDCLAKICTEILGDITMAEYVKAIALTS